jgi:NADH:ubiquinone oxidoreductase subunit 6 (subunit J)
MQYIDFIIGAIFWLLAALILFSGLMVVIVKNIIHAALWLISSFAGVAALYFLLEAPFIGVIQILVYTGAVSILVLFAIMLTRQVTGEATRQLFKRWPIAALVSIGLFGAMIVPAIWFPQLPPQGPGGPTYWPQNDLAAVEPAAETADGAAEPQPEAGAAGAPLASVAEIGRAFLGAYYIPFWVANLLLVVALIGAVLIAYEERTRRRRILTLAEEAELRRSLSDLGIDRPAQARADLPPGQSGAGTTEQR